MKTVSYKLPDGEAEKLEAIQKILGAASIHAAAKSLMLLQIPDSSSGRDVKLLELQADLHQIASELQSVVDSTEALAVFIGSLTELLLINLGNVSPEAAGEMVTDLYEASFGG